MYSDAVKVVGADFEVAELTVLIERALAGPSRPERGRAVASGATVPNVGPAPS